jgi:hypothetical protein
LFVDEAFCEVVVPYETADLLAAALLLVVLGLDPEE